MNRELRRALAPLAGTDALDQIREVMLKRYFDDWSITESVEEREHIHDKFCALDDMLTEFSVMITETIGER